MTPPELALVVPCYNEASRLDPDAFLQFVATHPGVQLVLVDDGSVDATGEILERLRAAAPAAVTTLRHAPRRGKAEAVRAGILEGFAQRAALVGFFDADLATHPGVQLVLVDDGSVDATGEILERLRAAAPAAVTTLRHAPRRGKAEAVRAGILEGFAQRAALVGFFDADLATPFRAIDDFLAVLRARPDVEFVLGSRVMLMGRDIRRKATRHYFGRVFATGVSFALDLPVYDTQCGAKILRANAATATLFAAPFRSAWIFDVELIARYLRLPVAPGERARRDRLYELVLPSWHDKPGSRLRWYDFPRAAVELGYIWHERVAHRPPGGDATPAFHKP